MIATGDALFGSSVTELHFFRQGLNDAGQVAFVARLDDGTSGIYRADPEEQSPRAAPGRAAAERHPTRVEPSALAGSRIGDVNQPVPSAPRPLAPQVGQARVGQGSPVPMSVTAQRRATDTRLAGARRAQPPEWASGLDLERLWAEFACHGDAG